MIREISQQLGNERVVLTMKLLVSNQHVHASSTRWADNFSIMTPRVRLLVAIVTDRRCFLEHEVVSSWIVVVELLTVNEWNLGCFRDNISNISLWFLCFCFAIQQSKWWGTIINCPRICHSFKICWNAIQHRTKMRFVYRVVFLFGDTLHIFFISDGSSCSNTDTTTPQDWSLKWSQTSTTKAWTIWWCFSLRSVVWLATMPPKQFILIL